jgi:hypothetical protein
VTTLTDSYPSRLDLRPGHTDTGRRSPTCEQALPPPLAWELDGHEEPAADPQSSRLSPVFDIHRLRQASAEEQMEILRQLREDGIARDAPEAETARSFDVEQTQHGVRFADRLRERFHISTRAQSANRNS